jgi:lipid-binding SYLF domain-containing protein
MQRSQFMTLQKTSRRVALAITLSALGCAASAQDTSTSTSRPASRADSAAVRHVEDAAAVVRRLAGEPGIDRLLAQSKGVFIVPKYGRAAIGLGAAGGAGVLLARHSDGTWSDPAFFNIGGLSVGLQAGAEGGPVAMILNNDKAVDSFRKKNNFSLSADAGLTVVNWSRQAQGSAGTGDVVVWSGTKGLFGNVATLAINDIRYNEKATQSYYGKNMAAGDVLSGKASNPHADALKQALAGTAGASAK